MGASSAKLLKKPLREDIVLTIGIVSNHGNWYTHSSMNKELKVLSGSYDWLLFLSDEGLSKFVEETIINPTTEYKAIEESFLRSYDRSNTSGNSFTKVKIDMTAALAVEKYFSNNISEIEASITVVSPSSKGLSDLKKILDGVSQKSAIN